MQIKLVKCYDNSRKRISGSGEILFEVTPIQYNELISFVNKIIVSNSLIHMTDEQIIEKEKRMHNEILKATESNDIVNKHSEWKLFKDCIWDERNIRTPIRDMPQNVIKAFNDLFGDKK